MTPRLLALNSCRNFFVFLLFLGVFFFPAQYGYTQEQEAPLSKVITRADDELLIFKLNLGKMSLVEGMIAYQDFDTDTYYIPLQDVLTALEMPITIGINNTTAQGWFIDEDNTFNLDINAETLTIKDTNIPLETGDLEMHIDGIYVSLKALEKWFPVTIDVDFNELAVIINSLEPLPIELRIAREKNRYSSKKKDKEAIIYDDAELEQKNFTLPTIDTSTLFRYSNTKGSGEEARAVYSGSAQALVANQDVNIDVSDSTGDGSAPDIRMTIGRQDVDGDLFKPFGFTEYSIGDIISNSNPLTSKGNSGRGIFVSNFPLDSNKRSRNNTTILRGLLLAGYQVDLMRNGEILDFIEEPNDDGEYVFEDVELFEGLNIFQLVFYGPQGQKETKEERIFLPSNPVQEGVMNFKASIIQDNTNLFSDRASSNPDTGELRLMAEAEYGITPETALYSTYNSYSLDGKNKLFLTTGIGTSLFGIRSNIRAAIDNDDGRAYELQMQGILSNTRWQISHKHYDNFISEITDGGDLPGILTSETSGRLNGRISLGYNNILPISINMTHLKDDQGNTQLSTKARFTQNISKLRLTAEINNIVQTNRDPFTDLNLLISSRFNDFSIRGEARYEIEPEASLKSIAVSSDFYLDQDLTLSPSYRLNMSSDTSHTLALGVSKKLDTTNVSFNMSHNSNGNTIATIGLAKSIGYDVQNNRLIQSANKLTTNSILSADVFIDENNNGVFDEGDSALEDVTFYGDGIPQNIATDKQGKLYLTRLRSYDDINLGVNPASLPSPFLQPKMKKEKYHLRPGVIYNKNFPIVRVGEIDGSINALQYGQELPVQSIEIELTDIKTGKVAKTTTSEFDGFYFLSHVLVGDYTAQPNPEQLEKLGYCPVKSQSVSLSSDDSFKTLNTFTLYPRYLPDEGGKAIILKQGNDLISLQEEWENLQTTYPSALSLALPYYIEDNGIYSLILGPYLPEKMKEVCTTLEKEIADCTPVTWEFCPMTINHEDNFTDNLQ